MHHVCHFAILNWKLGQSCWLWNRSVTIPTWSFFAHSWCQRHFFDSIHCAHQVLLVYSGTHMWWTPWNQDTFARSYVSAFGGSILVDWLYYFPFIPYSIFVEVVEAHEFLLPFHNSIASLSCTTQEDTKVYRLPHFTTTLYSLIDSHDHAKQPRGWIFKYFYLRICICGQLVISPLDSPETCVMRI